MCPFLHFNNYNIAVAVPKGYDRLGQKKATIPGNGKGPYRPQREADKGTFIFTISCTMQIYR